MIRVSSKEGCQLYVLWDSVHLHMCGLGSSMSIKYSTKSRGLIETLRSSEIGHPIIYEPWPMPVAVGSTRATYKETFFEKCRCKHHDSIHSTV